MLRIWLVALRVAAAPMLLAAWACGPGGPDSTPQTLEAPPPAAAPAAPAAAQATPEAAGPMQRVAIRGTGFVLGEAPFEWRGISAFRLAEQIAHGREAEAVAFLDWARGRQLNVVRVFAMAHHLFALTPADGVRALPRLLELAAARGLHVEIVALTDTAAIAVDHAQHVAAVGAVAAAHRNALVEIANEPWHPTQDRRLHDPAYVKKLSAAVPAGVLVALGSAEGTPGYAEGAYATWHSPRGSGQEGWQHVLQLAEGPALVQAWGKPVVSDEPIGAADAAIAGRRDNAPEHFGAAAALTRLAGLGATFHYEGGLQSRIPAGRELECFTAWSEGLALLSGLPQNGRFLNGDELAAIGRAQGVRAAFGRASGAEVWLVGVNPAPGAAVAWSGGWKARGEPQRAPGVVLFRGRR